MSKLYLFDLIDFDENGAVCTTKKYGKEDAQKNFLYLISKFNQVLLKQQSLKLPNFFKEDFQNTLKMPYAYAKKAIFSNCLPEIENLASLPEQEVLFELIDTVKIADEKTISKLNSAVNGVQKGYIITSRFNKVFGNICSLIAKDEIDKAEKSMLYKNIIECNALSRMAEKLKSGEENLNYTNYALLGAAVQNSSKVASATL